MIHQDSPGIVYMTPQPNQEDPQPTAAEPPLHNLLVLKEAQKYTYRIVTNGKRRYRMEDSRVRSTLQEFPRKQSCYQGTTDTLIVQLTTRPMVLAYMIRCRPITTPGTQQSRALHCYED